jgi:hypothetical protein
LSLERMASDEEKNYKNTKRRLRKKCKGCG